MAGNVRFQLRSYRVLQTAFLVLLLGGCALSPEQLSLPGSIIGPSDGSAASNSGDTSSSSNNGWASSADGSYPDTRSPHIREGSGEFVSGTPGEGGEGDQTKGSLDENGGVTLNLVGASVPEVAKTILGDILKLNYTISDKVAATITLSTSRPVPKENLLEIFETILRSEGISLAEKNGVYHIVPGDATVDKTPRWASSRSGSKVGPSTAIVTLRFVSATEMERILKAVAPQSSILRADEARNLLVVSGSRAELASINTTVKAFDVDWMRGMSFALLPVESGDPEAVARELDTVFANDVDSPTKGIIRFIPNTRLKSVLVISSRPEYLRRAASWVRRIDLAGQATEKQVHVYHVKNRPAAELAALLRRVYSSQAGARVQVETATQPQEAVTTLSAEGGTGGGGANRVSADQGLSADLGAALGRAQRSTAVDQGTVSVVAQATTGEEDAPPSGASPGGISIVADDPNNSLIITATYDEYRRIRKILSQIDIAANQVLLEATIAEVTLTDTLRFGLKWFFEKGNNSATFATNNLGEVVSTFPGFSYFLDTPNVQVALDALNAVTKVDLVSSPSLMVLDNKKALLQIGDEVPIATAQQQSTQAPDAPIINSISFRSTGVILGITPRIGENGRVQLDIEQEVSDVKATDSSTLDSPTIAQRRVKTSVAVGDGESIVLAGLMRDRNSVGHTKVPLVGDIPVVGNLFKEKNDEITRTELLIAITPHIVKDPRQIRGIADEFRDRLNFRTRPQRGGPPDHRENVDRLIVR